MMTDRKLLGQLAAIVSQQPIYGREPNFTKGVGHATNCLVYIEEPGLKVLEIEASGTSAVKAQNKIQKAINARKKNFPKSNWYSATGKKRG